MASDVHLRSIREILRYKIQGNDEAIGHLDDFVVDDQSWEVRYLAVDTVIWWFGKKVLVAPNWISRVSWAERTVHVNMSRQAIQDSPEWNATAAVNREYETRLYDYYGRPAYWSEGDRQATTPLVTYAERSLLESLAAMTGTSARKRADPLNLATVGNGKP